MTSLNSSLEILAKIREETDTVLVAYSGGKDSLCVLDLAVKTFPNVVCFFMYTIKGFEYMEPVKNLPGDRYGIKCLEYPNFLSSEIYKRAIYRIRSKASDKLPSLKQKDLFDKVRRDTGIKWVLTGEKKADGMHRLLKLRQFELEAIDRRTFLCHVITQWKKSEVNLYCSKLKLPKEIERAKQIGNNIFNIDTLKLIKNEFPNDYSKIVKEFPLIEGLLIREQFYGKSTETNNTEIKASKVGGCNDSSFADKTCSL